jgi:endonuclease YncB( thermonuclease family)
MNHYNHAYAAQRALEQEVRNDLDELGQEKEDFHFFVAFASEIMDRYGRLLAYINRSQKNDPRPLDYNSRMLRAGMANPYFIWPNINPFRKQKSTRDSVPDANSANTIATKESTLRQARQWVQDARTQGLGLFKCGDPLKLQPFELRFLAQRRVPNRWMIDLSKNNDVLIHPEEYYTIPNIEDRLFIPDEFVPLFVEKGWRKS